MDDKELGGLGGMLAMFGAGFSNSNAEKSVANFKAKQLELNAQLADLQGESTLRAGEAEAVVVGEKVGKEVGAARASFAGQGVDVDTGSAQAVQSSSDVQGQLAEETIRSNAWRQAWGFDVEASNYRSQAEMTRAEGEQESENTLLTAGAQGISSLVKGFSK